MKKKMNSLITRVTCDFCGLSDTENHVFGVHVSKRPRLILTGLTHTTKKHICKTCIKGIVSEWSGREKEEEGVTTNG